MEPLITVPLKEWNAIQERISRAEDELKQIYSALQPLHPAKNADEWGMNLVNILIARLAALEAAQHGVQPTADAAKITDQNQSCG